MKMKKGIRIGLILLFCVALAIIPISMVNAENRNNNPLLREILINGEEIKPKFDQFITDYVIAVDKENIEIKATPDDPNASVEIIGNTKLEIGKNDIEVKVIAEDKKTTQSYYLHVTRGDVNKANANLKNIEVDGLILNPKFNEKDINYLVEYEGYVEKLNINVIPENENAKIEILDNNNFNSTIHIVTIKVTAEDGITTKEYKLTAKKAGESDEDPSGLENEVMQTNERKEQKTNNNVKIACIALILIVVVIVINMIIKSKKNK